MATAGRSDYRQQCDALGVARVRALLREGDGAADWRHEAQAWLDDRLRREGERAYALVLTSIVLLSAAIFALVFFTWG